MVLLSNDLKLGANANEIPRLWKVIASRRHVVQWVFYGASSTMVLGPPYPKLLAMTQISNRAYWIAMAKAWSSLDPRARQTRSLAAPCVGGTSSPARTGSRRDWWPWRSEGLAGGRRRSQRSGPLPTATIGGISHKRIERMPHSGTNNVSVESSWWNRPSSFVIVCNENEANDKRRNDK